MSAVGMVTQWAYSKIGDRDTEKVKDQHCLVFDKAMARVEIMAARSLRIGNGADKERYKLLRSDERDRLQRPLWAHEIQRGLHHWGKIEISCR